MNREKFEVQPSKGKRLKGTSKSDPVKNLRRQALGNGKVEVKFDVELRFDRKAVRGLFKIALESVAFFEGLAIARRREFDGIREFVRHGKGEYRAIMLPDQNESYESYFGPTWGNENHQRIAGFTLLGMGFICDFDPEFRGGQTVLAEMKRQSLSGQVIPNWPISLFHNNNPTNSSS